MNRFDRIHGCLAGLAIGDALGMPVEFLSQEEIAREYGWVDTFVASPAWHPHARLLPGHVTDDTGQALAVLHAYSQDGQLTAGAVARELLHWADSVGDILPLVIGPSTAQALEKLRYGENPRLSGRQGKSNGAAYRAVPVGLLNRAGSPTLIDQVVQACLPTHGTTVAISGAAAVAYAIAAALEDGSSVRCILDAASQGAIEGRLHGEWAWGTPLEKRIDLALESVQHSQDEKEALSNLADYVGTDMLVAESVASAFGLVALSEGDPMKAVLYGANIGGDTDTIAAIAGAVCGALRGIQAINPHWLAELEAVNSLNLAAEARYIEAIAIRQGIGP